MLRPLPLLRFGHLYHSKKEKRKDIDEKKEEETAAASQLHVLHQLASRISNGTGGMKYPK